MPRQDAENPVSAEKIVAEDPIAAALSPFWRGGAMSETVLFIRDEPGARPKAKLLFAADSISRLTNATRDTAFDPGRDYLWNAGERELSLPEGSSIPFKTLDQLKILSPANAPDDPQGFHNLQVEVTYASAPGQWNAYVPALAEAELPRTLAKLHAKQPLGILLVGDSISEGLGSSAYMKVPPHLPAYGEQVAKGLERAYGGSIEFNNAAQAGRTALWGAMQAAQERLGARRPDLAIVAFGMNDVAFSMIRSEFTSALYGNAIRAIVGTIRQESPDTEFILVASMLGNSAAGLWPAERFPLYRDEIKRLVGPGIALADMTAVWQELLKRKSFFDAIFNGVNHPNDYGHRLYAQTILGLLAEPTV